MTATDPRSHPSPGTRGHGQLNEFGNTRDEWKVQRERRASEHQRRSGNAPLRRKSLRQMRVCASLMFRRMGSVWLPQIHSVANASPPSTAHPMANLIGREPGLQRLRSTHESRQPPGVGTNEARHAPTMTDSRPLALRSSTPNRPTQRPRRKWSLPLVGTTTSVEVE